MSHQKFGNGKLKNPQHVVRLNTSLPPSVKPLNYKPLRVFSRMLLRYL